MFYLQKMFHKQCYSQQLRHPEHWVGLAFWNIRCKGVGSEGLVDEEHEFSMDEVFNLHILAYLHFYIFNLHQPTGLWRGKKIGLEDNDTPVFESSKQG